MMPRNRLWAAFLAPLILGGCLLPQPDTPPVPPLAGRSGKAPVGVAPVLPQPDTPPITPVKPTNPGTAAGATAPETGKLIPQPDTPPVTPMLPQPDTPPVGATTNNGATLAPKGQAGIVPNAGTLPNAADSGAAVGTPGGMATTVTAPNPAASVAPVAPGTLSGTFSGLVVTTVVVTDETGSTTFQKAAVGSDGAFSFQLAPGRYKLLVTTGGKALQVGEVFEVESGVTHAYTITLHGAPLSATVSENVALADPAATP